MWKLQTRLARVSTSQTLMALFAFAITIRPSMKLSHFAQALTLVLIAVTAYLSWQAQQEASKASAKVDQFTQQQRAVASAQAEASASLVPGLATPMSMPAPAPSASSLPPLPAAPPAAAPAPVVASAPVQAIAAAPVPSVPSAAPAPVASKPSSPGLTPATPVSRPAGSAPIAVAPAPSPMPLITPLQRRVKDSPALGKVKEALMEQGFVALDVGSKNGLKAGLKLDLRRDSAIVGRVTVTSVEEGEAIADLDVKSIPPGVKVQPGDELISIVLAQ